MSKTTKIMLALGVAAGGGLMAATNTFATSETTEHSVTLQAQVNGSVGLDVNKTSIDFGSIAPGQASGADDTKSVELTLSTNALSGAKINAYGTDLENSSSAANKIQPSASAAAGTSGWSVKIGSDGTPVAVSTAQASKTVLYNTGTISAAVTQTKDAYFVVGTSSTQAEGTYTGTIYFTASTND